MKKTKKRKKIEKPGQHQNCSIHCQQDGMVHRVKCVGTIVSNVWNKWEEQVHGT